MPGVSGRKPERTVVRYPSGRRQKLSWAYRTNRIKKRMRHTKTAREEPEHQELLPWASLGK